MRHNKGQAAMEFLMTYGWAIIVVLAAVAALAYFGVLSPDKILPEKTTFTAPTPSLDKATITSVDAQNPVDATFGTVQVAFTNNVGNKINVDNNTIGSFNFSVDSGTIPCSSDRIDVFNATGGNIGNGTIVNGQAFRVRWNCNAPVAKGRFSADAYFTYVNSYTGLPSRASGSIVGRAV